MNHVFLIGRLTRDPETKTVNQHQYTKFSIAVDRYGSGENKVADFINITAWDKLAENCAKFLSKGKQIAVTGSIQTGTYEKDGVKHSTFDIRATGVEFLSPANPGGAAVIRTETDTLTPVDDDGDMPF